MKVPNIKFHGNPFSGSRSDTCGQTDDMTKVRGAFRVYADAPNIWSILKSLTMKKVASLFST
jgi:hypothetical protein